jgi:catechol 2,3-dioxygenase-like lactoylglutathione lyase family enzyme
MLKNGRVATRLPAQDLERARRYYAEKLGLEPVEVREGGLRYVCGGAWFRDSEGNMLGIGQPVRG